MSSFKNTTKQSVLNHFLRKSAYTPSTQTTLALFTAAPTDSAQGTEVLPTGTNYTRQNITWNAGATRYITNNGAINFSCSGSAFGNVEAAAVCFGGGEGDNDQLCWDNFTAKAIGDGDTMTFPDATGLKVEFSASGASGGLKTTAANKILDFVFRNTAWSGTGSTDPYIALFETGTTLSDSAAGDECDETSNGYARQQCAFNAPTQSGEYYYCDNTSDEQWTATADWSLAIDGAAVCVADVEGVDDIMWWGTITSTTMTNGDILKFVAGNLKCQCS